MVMCGKQTSLHISRHIIQPWPDRATTSCEQEQHWLAGPNDDTRTRQYKPEGFVYMIDSGPITNKRHAANKRKVRNFVNTTQSCSGSGSKYSDFFCLSLVGLFHPPPTISFLHAARCVQYHRVPPHKKKTTQSAVLCAIITRKAITRYNIWSYSFKYERFSTATTHYGACFMYPAHKSQKETPPALTTVMLLREKRSNKLIALQRNT